MLLWRPKYRYSLEHQSCIEQHFYIVCDLSKIEIVVKEASGISLWIVVLYSCFTNFCCCCVFLFEECYHFHWYFYVIVLISVMLFVLSPWYHLYVQVLPWFVYVSMKTCTKLEDSAVDSYPSHLYFSICSYIWHIINIHVHAIHITINTSLILHNQNGTSFQCVNIKIINSLYC